MMHAYHGRETLFGMGGILFWVGLTAVGVPVLIAVLRFYFAILRDLPNISNIEKYSFSQATVIADKNGEPLYRLFEEHREYIPYEKISPYFVNALVATEDQRFWTNPGVDRKGTLRAAITDVTQGKTIWGSTITQQLIKNLMLTPEKKVERKVKEIILAIKLNSYIKREIKNAQSDLSSDELDKKVKEKILEMYANYIFLGNNSYGVQVASLTYFGVGADKLDVLQAAILAGIPQAPSRYDPYTNNGAVMGKINIVDDETTPVELTTELNQLILERVQQNMDNAKLAFKKSDDAIISFMEGLLDFSLTYQGQTYQVSYTPGRKDIVLARMYEEWYITESEFKKNFLRGLNFTFARARQEIKAPHFVFWVTKLLEEKYDAELLRKGGLTITTTLDYNIQKMAEESINENQAVASQYKSNNAAMMYVNSLNGDVMAYVGSRDYYNEEIDGQVDIIQSKRQPWSSIKPFVYSLGFMKNPLTIDSPIYDLAFTIGKDKPNNADGTFKGLMPIKLALAGSRNIPAIKMLMMAGGEGPIKQFLQKLGIVSLDMSPDHYGYPLAIGSAEIPMYELVTAYTHLSAMGTPAEINPILEIRAADGSILYKKQVKQREQVIPTGVAFLLWKILSDNSNLPASWIQKFTIPGLTMATKTGTTNVVDPKTKEKLPRDGWLVWYTPSSVMVFWGWNTDGSALRRDAYGGWINNLAWRNFIKKLQGNNLISNQLPEQKEVKSVTISKISGKLVNADSPLAFAVTSLGYINTLPTAADTSLEVTKVDALCNGKVWSLTPEWDVKDAYIIKPESMLPDKRDQKDINNRWGSGAAQSLLGSGILILLEAPQKECEERNALAQMWQIALNIIQPEPGQKVTRTFSVWHQTKSPFKITSVKIYLNDVELKSYTYDKQWGVVDITNVTLPSVTKPGNYELKVMMTDEKGYSDSKTIPIVLIWEDTTPPFLMTDKVKVIKRDTGWYDVVLLFSDVSSTIKKWSIQRGWEDVYTFDGNLAVFSVESLGQISYTIIDSANNKWWGTLMLKETQ